MAPGPDRVAELGDEGGLLGPLDLLLDHEGGGPHLGLGGAGADRDAGRQALAEVRVQQRLDGGVDLVGGADAEAPEAVVLVEPEGDLGRVAQVLGGQLVGVVLEAVVLAAAGVVDLVVVAGQRLEQLAVLDQLTELEHEHARPLPVDEQHAEAARAPARSTRGCRPPATG